MRFLLDMGVSQSVAMWLKSLGHDALHLNEQSLHLLEDLSILEKAIAEKRIILTTDMDFGQLLAFNKHALRLLYNFGLQFLLQVTFAKSSNWYLKDLQIN